MKNYNNSNKNKASYSNSYSNRPKNKQEVEKIIHFKYGMKVPDLSIELGIPNALLIKKFMLLGEMVNMNTELDIDIVKYMAEEEGYAFELAKLEDDILEDEPDNPSDLVKRAPIVTVMGHVDHGKTTLLDSIRKSRVVDSEAGGITQHIGAYQVNRKGYSITFIDTPGHAAFTEMRARGAKITDVVVLVVAADDGVMPQTREAIDHAKAGNVPIVVAINKIDKNNANPEVVISELSKLGLIPEEWGGTTPFVHISALRKEGIDSLLDILELVSEIKELKANPNRRATGTVIEASLDKGKGPTATVIVQNGTLKQGDYISVGTSYGRIRSITDDLNRLVKEAYPSQPVEITGLNEVPKAGDTFKVFSDERLAKVSAERKKLSVITEKDQSNFDPFEVKKKVSVIIKTDVNGSIDALKNVLKKLESDVFSIDIVLSMVGGVTENDVVLAKASNAMVIAFNIRPTSQIKSLADEQGVTIKTYNIIYRVQEDIEAMLKGMLDKTYEDIVIGTAEVRQLFKVAKIGTIAGCYVTHGIIKRDSSLKVIRDQVVVYEGAISSLRRGKDDVKEVKTNFECGITISNFNDIKEGDIIEASEKKEVEVA
ncbi:MAG: translation initiation factor IF-2 [Acholeplasmatales bacterium]|jgi:translation initiation factor IF-2|nr:translation initiation factor IF-2 [Acholeplasmatales bacterium]